MVGAIGSMMNSEIFNLDSHCHRYCSALSACAFVAFRLKDLVVLFAEIERDNSKRSFQSWNARYPKPFKQSNSTSPLYYSFDYGGELVPRRNAWNVCTLCCLSPAQLCCWILLVHATKVVQRVGQR